MERAAVIALAGGFFLVGGVVIFRSLVAMARGYASQRWPQATGTIIESRVEERINADGQLLFFPHVRYWYRVGGEEYESTTIRFPTNSALSHNRAEAIVARYPVTASIRVSYLVEKPSIAVLEPGLTGNAFVGVVLGLGVLLGSVAGCYYVLLARGPY
jgi:hypothetical protein